MSGEEDYNEDPIKLLHYERDKVLTYSVSQDFTIVQPGLIDCTIEDPGLILAGEDPIGEVKLESSLDLINVFKPLQENTTYIMKKEDIKNIKHPKSNNKRDVNLNGDMNLNKNTRLTDMTISQKDILVNDFQCVTQSKNKKRSVCSPISVNKFPENGGISKVTRNYSKTLLANTENQLNSCNSNRYVPKLTANINNVNKPSIESYQKSLQEINIWENRTQRPETVCRSKSLYIPSVKETIEPKKNVKLAGKTHNDIKKTNFEINEKTSLHKIKKNEDVDQIRINDLSLSYSKRSKKGEESKLSTNKDYVAKPDRLKIIKCNTNIHDKVAVIEHRKKEIENNKSDQKKYQIEIVSKFAANISKNCKTMSSSQIPKIAIESSEVKKTSECIKKKTKVNNTDLEIPRVVKKNKTSQKSLQKYQIFKNITASKDKKTSNNIIKYTNGDSNYDSKLPKDVKTTKFKGDVETNKGINIIDETVIEATKICAKKCKKRRRSISSIVQTPETSITIISKEKSKLTKNNKNDSSNNSDEINILKDVKISKVEKNIKPNQKNINDVKMVDVAIRAAIISKKRRNTVSGHDNTSLKLCNNNLPGNKIIPHYHECPLTKYKAKENQADVSRINSPPIVLQKLSLTELDLENNDKSLKYKTGTPFSQSTPSITIDDKKNIEAIKLAKPNNIFSNDELASAMPDRTLISEQFSIQSIVSNRLSQGLEYKNCIYPRPRLITPKPSQIRPWRAPNPSPYNYCNSTPNYQYPIFNRMMNVGSFGTKPYVYRTLLQFPNTHYQQSVPWHSSVRQVFSLQSSSNSTLSSLNSPNFNNTSEKVKQQVFNTKGWKQTTVNNKIKDVHVLSTASNSEINKLTATVDPIKSNIVNEPVKEIFNANKSVPEVCSVEPFSKKIKGTEELLKKEYSPPILPILSYSTIVHILQSSEYDYPNLRKLSHGMSEWINKDVDLNKEPDNSDDLNRNNIKINDNSDKKIKITLGEYKRRSFLSNQ